MMTMFGRNMYVICELKYMVVFWLDLSCVFDCLVAQWKWTVCKKLFQIKMMFVMRPTFYVMYQTVIAWTIFEKFYSSFMYKLYWSGMIYKKTHCQLLI
jgi:hypothetical protein